MDSGAPNPILSRQGPLKSSLLPCTTQPRRGAPNPLTLQYLAISAILPLQKQKGNEGKKEKRKKGSEEGILDMYPNPTDLNSRTRDFTLNSHEHLDMYSIQPQVNT